MADRIAGRQIYELIPLIMLEVGAVAKTGVNKQSQGPGYAFRKIDDVYASLQPIMAKHGVFSVPEVLYAESEERPSKSGGVLIYRKLKIKYDFFAPDGSFVSATVLGEAMDTGDKAANKAMAAAHKYALTQTFLIPTEEKKDSEEDSHEVGGNVVRVPEQNKEPDQPYQAPRKDMRQSPISTAKVGGVSAKQIGRLWGIAGKVPYSKEEVHAFIKAKWNLDSVMDLDWKQYQQLCGDDAKGVRGIIPSRGLGGVIPSNPSGDLIDEMDDFPL